MANTMQPTTNKRAHNKDPRMFLSTSEDTAMTKQIQATHSPDGHEVDLKPIMYIIEDALRRASHSIDGVVNGMPASLDTLDDKEKINLTEYNDGMLEGLAYTIHKISCEMSCKCSGGGDAHTTTMAIFKMLSNYSWDAKVVLTLAAFSTNYGEFWLVAQLYVTNELAKSIALLKQFPNIMEHSNSMKHRFDSINNLVNAICDVTKCMVEFKELPSHYISHDTPPLSIAMAHIPIASYWIIRSIVACATHVTSLMGSSHEYLTSTTEGWELSSMAHKISSIHDLLRQQLAICHQHIDEKRDIEAYHTLVRLFESIHHDNNKILRALIYMKDDIQPLVHCSQKTRASLDVLRRKNVLLLISDFNISNEEITVLSLIYNDSRTKPELNNYEIVWLPIVERHTTSPQKAYDQGRFEELKSMMDWYTVYDPTILEPAAIRYIKEVWNFSQKMIIVVLDPLGRVSSKNALNMLWIWGNMAFPFANLREEALWKAESWRLELLVDDIDPSILESIPQGKYICLYGGADIEWIRKFTMTSKSVAGEAGIDLDMVYIGKSNTKERTGKNMKIIHDERLSRYWPDLTSIWYFWSRMESMLYSKLKLGKTVENDTIVQEVMQMLSFDGSSEQQGWAVFCKGSAEMAKGKGEIVLNSLMDFDSWKENARVNGFIHALNDHLAQLQTPHHCNRLILPGINGEIPEVIVCAECGRPMEKFFMYRCCTD